MFCLPSLRRMEKYKRPESVLVLVHTAGSVLLLERADDLSFWQSVTGSMYWHEALPIETARRELHEETGLVDMHGLKDLGRTYRYPILPRWRARYAPDVLENIEHVFGLEFPAEVSITVSPEHVSCGWFPFAEAVGRASSWSNREVIELIRHGRNRVGI